VAKYIAIRRILYHPICIDTQALLVYSACSGEEERIATCHHRSGGSGSGGGWVMTQALLVYTASSGEERRECYVPPDQSLTSIGVVVVVVVVRVGGGSEGGKDG